MSGYDRKPSLRQRLGFLCERGVGYAWILLTRKLGRRRLAHRIAGRRYALSTTDEALELIRDDEPWMVPLMRRVLPVAQGAFVDVGVNVGQTLLRLKGVEPGRPWIGFEPNPNCCRAVRRLLQDNDLAPAKLNEYGLSNRSGKAALHIDRDADVRGTTIEGFHGVEPGALREVEVELRNGGELLESEFARKVGFVKIDVEGAECDVLEGLRPVIERDRPLVLLEILWAESDNPETERVRMERQRRTLGFFDECAYKIKRVRGGGRLEEFGDIRKRLPLDMCNYLAFPAESAEDLNGRPG